MQEADLLVEATTIFEAIVSLVEEGESCELGAWDLREGVEEEAVDDDVSDEGSDEPCGVDPCLRAESKLQPHHGDGPRDTI